MGRKSVLAGLFVSGLLLTGCQNSNPWERGGGTQATTQAAAMGQSQPMMMGNQRGSAQSRQSGAPPVQRAGYTPTTPAPQYHPTAGSVFSAPPAPGGMTHPPPGPVTPGGPRASYRSPTA